MILFFCSFGKINRQYLYILVYSLKGITMKYIYFIIACFLALYTTTVEAKTFKYNLRVAPPTLNPFTSVDMYAYLVHKRVFETLLVRDIETYEFKPYLAKSWSVSKDNKEFTFVLRSTAKWHDGKPLTVEDVKFTFDAIKDPKNKYKVTSLKGYLENIVRAKVINKNTIKFYAKDNYFKNLDMISLEMFILPKHIYENPKIKLSSEILGSGPYHFVNFNRRKSIKLKRNDNWWGYKDSYFKKEFNFNNIVMKFTRDSTQSLQMLRMGDLDYTAMNSKSYVKEAVGDQWGKKYFKVQYKNNEPKGFSVLGLNLKDPRFTSRKTRIALTHLVNRKLMVEKFLYNQSELVSGPTHPSSPFADSSIPEIEYSPKKAISLLKEEGWEDSDGDKVLDKTIEGKKHQLEFTIISPSLSYQKFLTIFQEDAKKVGVKVNIKHLEWNSFIRNLYERKFEVAHFNTGSTYLWDPKSVWHSESIGQSGHNYIHYANTKVDKLISEQRIVSDLIERKKILREIYKEIANDVPAIFMFTSKYNYYGHSKRINKLRNTFSYDVGIDRMWME